MIFPADDAVSDDPRPTALFAAIAASATANSWTSVNGFSVPRVYSNITEEYEAAHSRAGIVDAGPLVRYTVRGAAAAELVARATTTPAATLDPGESARGLMLDQSGAVVDLVETACIAPDLYLLSCSSPHGRRMRLARRGLDATVEDITGHVAALALVGPQARDAAAAAGLDVANEALSVQSRVRGVETSTRPFAFAGLPGVEVILPYDEALTLWERLRRAAKPRPIGLDALEIMRIEGGVPRVGVDFVDADSARAEAQMRSPASLGLAHLAPVSRNWFSGRAGLARRMRPATRLTVLAIDAAQAVPGAAVFAGKGEIGALTSAAFSPKLKRIVAFADLAAEATGPFEVALPAPAGGRARADLFETAESRLAAASAAGDRSATERRA
jgi:aminomethyltransferase